MNTKSPHIVGFWRRKIWPIEETSWDIADILRSLALMNIALQSTIVYDHSPVRRQGLAIRLRLS